MYVWLWEQRSNNLSDSLASVSPIDLRLISSNHSFGWGKSMATAPAQRLELIALVQQARDVLDLFLTLDSSNSDRAWEAIVELDAPRRRSYFTRKGLLLEG